MTDRPALAVEKVSRSYGELFALCNVSFSAHAGRILGILGPNGAGKTTLMSVIAGAILPDSGRVFLNGVASEETGAMWRRDIVFVPEEAPPLTHTTPREYLTLLGGVMGLHRATLTPRIEQALEACDLSGVADRRYEDLSKGFRRRVSLAGALVSRASVILLDEPTSSLDPQQRIDFEALVRSMASRALVVFSSHSIPEVEALCDDLLFMREGRVIAHGSAADLLGTSQDIVRLVIDLQDMEPVVTEVLGQAPAVLRSVQLRGSEQIVDYAIDAVSTRQNIISWAVEAGIPILSVSSSRMSLQDLYLRLTEVVQE